jgi:hypothetical protein
MGEEYGINILFVYTSSLQVRQKPAIDPTSESSNSPWISGHTSRTGVYQYGVPFRANHVTIEMCGEIFVVISVKALGVSLFIRNP